MGRSLALIVVALLATGCATRASYHRLTADVAALRGEVTDLRQAQEAAARGVARTATRGPRARGPDHRGEWRPGVSASELTTLRERVETAEAGCARRVAQASPPRRAGDAARAATRRAVTAAPRAITPAPRTVRARLPSREGAEPTYQAALAAFRAREYGQAVLDFADFMAKYPRHPLVANAQYGSARRTTCSATTGRP